MRSLKANAAAGLLGKPKCVCGEPYIILPGRDTIWCSAGCEWSRGSGFDMLASHLGGYDEAVVAAASLEPWLEGDTGYAGILRNHRELLELLLGAAGKSSGRSMETVSVRESFHRLCRCRPHGVIHLDRQEVLRLILILAERGVTIPPGLHDRGASIIPHWSSPHEPAYLKVFPQGSRSFTGVQLRPCRYAWSGLHLAHADCAQLDVYPDFFDVAQYQEVYLTTLINKVPTAAHCSPLSSEEAVGLGSLRFISPGGKWDSYLPAWSHIAGFEQAEFTEDPMVGGSDLMEIIQGLLASLPAPQLVDTLGSMKLSEPLRHRLIKDTSGHPAGREIEECLSRVLLDLSEGIGVYRSVGGYETETDAGRTQTSNFAVALEAIVGFDRLNEIFYEAVVTMDGDTRRMELPGYCLDKPSLLEAAVRTGQIFNAPSKGIATVFDPKSMVRVLRLLRLGSKDLPRLRGYRNLGWSHKQDMFILPASTIGAARDIREARYRPAPDSDFFPYENYLLPEGAPDVSKIDPLQADLVSALVGCTIRSFHGLPMRLLPVVNSAEGRATLAEIFRTVGQTSGVRLTNVTQKHVDSLRGYPCLVTNVTDLQATTLGMCGVRLAEKGRILSGCGKLAGAALAWALSEVTAGLLSGEDVGFSEHKSVSMPNSFAQEGQRVLRRLFGTWPEAGAEWRTLDSFLLERGHDLEHKAHVCFEDDTVILHKEILEGVDTQDLAIELGLLCRRAQLVEGEMVIDRNTLYPVLEEFYGQIPKIRLVKALA